MERELTQTSLYNFKERSSVCIVCVHRLWVAVRIDMVIEKMNRMQLRYVADR